MADTEILTGDAIAVKRFDKTFMSQAAKKIFFAPMTGKDENNIVQTKLDLTKSPGDQVTIPLFPNLVGTGKTGDVDIEGQEEQITPLNDAVGINLYMNAFRTAGLLTEQRSPADLRSEARRVLSSWMAERIDSLGFTAIETSPSLVYAEVSDALTATSVTTGITATDLIEPMMASYLRAAAGTASPKIKPIKQGGRDIFILLMHTHCGYDMKNDSTYQAFHRDLDPRDPKDAYLFKAGHGAIDDVLLYTHENVATVTTWGGGAVYGAKNKFLGAQAMAMAWARYPFLVEKRFEYGTRWGAMVGAIFGFKKLTFNSKDNGLIELRTARTAIS